VSEPTEMTPSTLVSVRSLKAFYRRANNLPPVRALDDVNLEVARDEIIGIAGESGCGKSTLLKVLNGAIKPPLRLESGEVEFHTDGASVAVTDLHAMRRLRWKAISYIPQSSMSVLNPVVRIGKQFGWVVSTHAKLDRAEAEARIRSFVTQVGLPERILNSFPHQLSGGMRQRVVIAMATFLHPRLVLADEPTTGLDVVVQRTVLEMIQGLQRDFHMTVLMVSHDMGIHYQVSDRTVVMYAGSIAEVAPTASLFAEPLHPYTLLLISSLPRLGDNQKREGIKGAPPNLATPPSGCRFHPRCPHAMEQCRTVKPELREVKPKHFVACHLFGESGSLA
jgi:peptide/nickel transport system ATP-binding protein